MLKGCDLNELQARIQQAEAAKSDFVVPTETLKAGGNDQGVFVAAGGNWYRTGEVAQDNLATLTGIPTKWFREIALTQPAFAGKVLNEQLRAKADELPKQRMLRTIGTKMRAVLSDKFLRLDHKLALEVALPQIQDSGAEIKSVLVTERRMSVQFVYPRLEGEVKVGDVVQFGGLMSNSEVGLSRWGLEELLFRLICSNGMIGMTNMGGFSRRHITGRQTATLTTLDRPALVEMMGMEMNALLSPDRFRNQLLVTKAAAGQYIPEEYLPQAIKVAQGQGLQLEESEAVMGDFLDAGDCSLWGLGNAITAQAHGAKVERSVELERVGAKVITLPKSAWKVV